MAKNAHSISTATDTSAYSSGKSSTKHGHRNKRLKSTNSSRYMVQETPVPVQTNSEISQNLKTSTLTTTTTNSNNDNDNGNTNEIAILNSSPLKQLSPSQPLPEVLPTEPDENQPASFEQSQSTKFPIDVIPIQSSHATNESSVLEDQSLLDRSYWSKQVFEFNVDPLSCSIGTNPININSQNTMEIPTELSFSVWSNALLESIQREMILYQSLIVKRYKLFQQFEFLNTIVNNYADDLIQQENQLIEKINLIKVKLAEIIERGI
ncbi:hypothetical protein MG5_01044 [Candida albicans P57072]|nr:hypothetical protein MG5_01044 [Candida albicans P57072]